ncbi:MAPEG family protein [Aquabacterium sp.]|uniref:MAPEG family protein n=1 Tax=Aquabacterium sp. TaxID=1872578 RepID=UPI003D6CB67A
MTIAKWTVLAAFMLPVLTVGMAKAATIKLGRRNGGYDNNNPREWAGKLSGWHQRAHAAQINGFEGLPLFAAAVIFAQMAQADQARIDMLALAYIGIRVVYVAMYLANLGALRTLVWTAGLATNIALLAMAA